MGGRGVGVLEAAVVGDGLVDALPLGLVDGAEVTDPVGAGVLRGVAVTRGRVAPGGPKIFVLELPSELSEPSLTLTLLFTTQPNSAAASAAAVQAYRQFVKDLVFVGCLPWLPIGAPGWRPARRLKPLGTEPSVGPSSTSGLIASFLLSVCGNQGPDVFTLDRPG